jgi:hydroxymethylglutaryl-CoA synthase
MNKIPTNVIGIDDMALHVPRLYLPIEDLAEARSIEYAKLNKGLGLAKMACPDIHEDAATMAANAVLELIERNQLHPQQIGRLYLGTESALDGAKPTATYVLKMLEQRLEGVYGKDCLRNCDVVDLTFACIGGIDALQNTLDWVAGDPERMGIVVTSDLAKYDLASTGEYTQGAGAVAMLVTHNPRLIAIRNKWGVATGPVHDFYKPKRAVSKLEIVEEVLRLMGKPISEASEILDSIPDTLESTGLLDDNDETLYMLKEMPVFDGPYSNQCYQERTRQAYEHFQQIKKAEGTNGYSFIQSWERLIFHLPYAFQAKRMFAELFMIDQQQHGLWEEFCSANGLDAEVPTDDPKAYAAYVKSISKTDGYRAMVKKKIEKSQRASSEVGNMYAGSIFLALMSSLHFDWKDGADLEGKVLGFFGYGSGSKSKVFEGVMQAGWKEVVRNFQLGVKLDKRTAINYTTYEQLHRGQLKESVQEPQQEFFLARVESEGTYLGARRYNWQPAMVEVPA